MAWAILMAEDGPEVFLIFTSRLCFRFCAFIVHFRAYIVRILSIIVAMSRQEKNINARTSGM